MGIQLKSTNNFIFQISFSKDLNLETIYITSFPFYNAELIVIGGKAERTAQPENHLHPADNL